MRNRSPRLKDYVTAYLMNLHIVSTPNEVVGEINAAQVAWEFQAMASTSSRTRRKRIAEGFCLSKK
jgi:hypothetical protein